MTWPTINLHKPRRKIWYASVLSLVLGTFVFQSCGDPGFNTAGPREDISKFDIASEFIQDIVQLETPRGKIDLLNGTITDYNQTRNLTVTEAASAGGVLASVEICKYILPRDVVTCMAMPVMDYVFTLTDGSQTSAASQSICYYDSLCPTTVNALNDLFDTLLNF